MYFQTYSPEMANIVRSKINDVHNAACCR